MTEVFGVTVPSDRTDARVLAGKLRTYLDLQNKSAGAGIRDPASVEAEELSAELAKFRTWFDPTAKGARLRSVLAKLTAPPRGDEGVPDAAATDLGDGRRLVTPEGYVLLWLLHRADGSGSLKFSARELDLATSALLDLYRTWSRRRLDDVVGLLASETSTLRPAAAGLLVTLLINRNTAPDRPLTRPRNPQALESVGAAIAAPALAYGETLGGRKTSTSSVDLYRGWALGELRRRLGPGFHSNLDDGIWLDEPTTAVAEQRLVDDILRRPPAARSQVGPAIDAACAAYERERPRLAALNLAFEQPGNTRRLRKLLEGAASSTQEEK